jgi:hypothetical protein
MDGAAGAAVTAASGFFSIFPRNRRCAPASLVAEQRQIAESPAHEKIV